MEPELMAAIEEYRRLREQNELLLRIRRAAQEDLRQKEEAASAAWAAASAAHARVMVLIEAKQVPTDSGIMEP